MPKTQRFFLRADSPDDEDIFYLDPNSSKTSFLALSGRQIQADENSLTLFDSLEREVASVSDIGLQPIGRFQWKFENDVQKVFTFTACSKVSRSRTQVLGKSFDMKQTITNNLNTIFFSTIGQIYVQQWVVHKPKRPLQWNRRMFRR